MKNVAIVTTRWDELEGEKQLKAARKNEAELLDRHFKDFINGQAQVHRHFNTLNSAEAVMSSLLCCSPIGKIRIVDEILSGKTLPETGAGLVLKDDSELVQLMTHYEYAIQFNNAEVALRGELEKLRAENLRGELEKLRGEHEKLRGEHEKLKKNHEALQLWVGRRYKVTRAMTNIWKI